MIARLRGEVIEAASNRLVVDCGGVGYEVHVSDGLLISHGILNTQVDLFVRHVIRETDQNLYGFATAEDRRLFDILRDVKGCGAKISLAILGTLGKEGTVQNIQLQDVKGLATTPGVGPRLAERIIVELKDKIAEFQWDGKVAAASFSSSKKPVPSDDELMEALLGLGYRRAEAEVAADKARETHQEIEQQLRAALKLLAK